MTFFSVFLVGFVISTVLFKMFHFIKDVITFCSRFAFSELLQVFTALIFKNTVFIQPEITTDTAVNTSYF